jgi:hypothetical protein
MKREFIVAKIEASQDGSPYVYVTFSDPKEYKPDKPTMNPFGASNVAAFSSMDDLMKNLPKVMAGFPGMMGAIESPTIKFSMREYQDMGIKVGDRVFIEIQKSESSGI